MAATVLLQECQNTAEFRNEPQLVTMQRNLRISGEGHNALPSPIRHFGGTCPPVSRGIYATGDRNEKYVSNSAPKIETNRQTDKDTSTNGQTPGIELGAF